MNNVYAYIRISDIKQEQGVSREQQKAFIRQHAATYGLNIIEWYVETCSASHRKRPLFTKMVRNLKQKKADGVIIHKVDRSARNPDDWHELMSLHDKRGVIVQFANNNLDLSTRSGRLTADLEAVIAADFSRNLRDEVKKGQNGRLQQGLYPFYAPIGYLNTGKGNVKTIDPVKAPIVKKLFELYATGEYSLVRLSEYANQHGLTNRNNNPLTAWYISKILHNPFYTGVIYVKTTRNTYIGRHKPIISTVLYERVQERFNVRTAPKSKKHNPTFKSLVRCKLCNYGMPAEKQKGRYYYRCQRTDCPTKTVREDHISKELDHVLSHLTHTPEVITSAKKLLEEKTATIEQQAAAAQRTAKMHEGNIQKKLDKLTDLLISGTLDEQTYITKKQKLHIALQKSREQAEQSHHNIHTMKRRANEILERAFCAQQGYADAFGQKKRHVAKKLVSNFFVEGKKPLIELKKPFDQLANLSSISQCTHNHNTARISDNVCQRRSKCMKYEESSQKTAQQIFDIVITFVSNEDPLI